MKTILRFAVGAAFVFLALAGIAQVGGGGTSTLTLTGGSMSPAELYVSGDAGVANILGVGNHLAVANTIDAGVLLLQAGTAANPAISWAADNDNTGTGLYRSAANTVSCSVNGALAFSVNTNGGLLPCGSVMNFCGTDSHAYLYRVSANTLRLGTSAGGGNLTISGSLVVDGTSTFTGKANFSAGNSGTISDMAGGDGTATVTSGAVCVCSCSGGVPTAMTCTVATTTLTATDATCTAVTYICDR